MPDVPYKYLKDENWETFYPITGPSSVNGQIPIANGGTGADTAAGARANLGAVSAHDVTLSSQPNDFILSVSEGGTGADNAADARVNLGAIPIPTYSNVTTLYSHTGTVNTTYTTPKNGWYLIDMLGYWGATSVSIGGVIIAEAQARISNAAIRVTTPFYFPAGTVLNVVIDNSSGEIYIKDIS